MAEAENEIFSDEHFQARLQSKQSVEAAVLRESDQHANREKLVRRLNANMFFLRGVTLMVPELSLLMT